MWAMARKSRFCQAGMVCSADLTTTMRDRK